MPGTREGGLKAAAKNLKRDPNFYAKIGAIGGRNGSTGGFASDTKCDCSLIEGDHFKRNCAGKRGGLKSRRGRRDTAGKKT